MSLQDENLSENLFIPPLGPNITVSEFESLIDRYCGILAPLFYLRGDRFDHIIAILRATAYENAGWDALKESFRILDELYYLASAELDSEYFSEPDVTRLRLGLLEYCHLVEMNAPYEIIANLCGVHLGMPVRFNPFESSSGKKKARKARPKSSKPPTPTQKIQQIKLLTTKIGLPDVGAAFDDFYRSGIRNSVSHSDFIIFGDEFRMRGQTVLSEDTPPVKTSVIRISRLYELLNNARAFYRAFVRVEKGARLEIGKHKGKGFRYDSNYKGILEILADEQGYLCGAVIHWPNSTESSYQRTPAGSRPLNLIPLDGNYETFVGSTYAEHDEFSPLVKLGEPPTYSPLKSSGQPLKWSECEETSY